MIVEFIGGTLNGQSVIIQQFTDYINNKGEIYYAHLLQYQQLRWAYVWYQFTGMARESEVFA